LALSTELVKLTEKDLSKEEVKTAISRHIQVSLWVSINFEKNVIF
jgi:hypothetical protein